MYMYNTAEVVTSINSIFFFDNTFTANVAEIAAVFYSNLPAYFAPLTLTNSF